MPETRAPAWLKNPITSSFGPFRRKIVWMSLAAQDRRGARLAVEGLRGEEDPAGAVVDLEMLTRRGHVIGAGRARGRVRPLQKLPLAPPENPPPPPPPENPPPPNEPPVWWW